MNGSVASICAITLNRKFSLQECIAGSLACTKLVDYSTKTFSKSCQQFNCTVSQEKYFLSSKCLMNCLTNLYTKCLKGNGFLGKFQPFSEPVLPSPTSLTLH
ncbi:unnamed protein product [Haemonchus placei]|uniref:ShKT domain-containing protein n=1 Tax=Haemonchus placei TaxID=6290 RepID=A0A0N4X8P6_HAEPC|nr:unnamed protein product [Haemonchus placei]